jgi:hypothetical protein
VNLPAALETAEPCGKLGYGKSGRNSRKVVDWSQPDGAAARTVALNVRVAVSGKLFDGGVERVHLAFSPVFGEPLDFGRNRVAVLIQQEAFEARDKFIRLCGVSPLIAELLEVLAHCGIAGDFSRAVALVGSVETGLNMVPELLKHVLPGTPDLIMVQRLRPTAVRLGHKKGAP